MIQTLLGSQFLLACLYAALAICCAGILWRLGRWFTMNSGPHAASIPVGRRILAVFFSMGAALASLRLIRLPRVLLLDVLLQARILRTDFLRWLMHVLIFFGFMGLLLMHALDELITRKLFGDYYSTFDPYQLLRNAFGLMVIIGVVIAIVRRVKYRGPILGTRSIDRVAIAIVTVIIASGFLVESTKMISEPVFNRMMVYAAVDEADQLPLKIHWAGEYGVVFENLDTAPTPELLARGKEVSEGSCTSCHSRYRSAFVSFPLSKALRPVGRILNKAEFDLILYYLHVLACLLGLAYLPFGKFFHLLTDPLTMIVNGLADPRKPGPASSLPRRAMEWDACTNCGTCSTYCSVTPLYRMMGNEAILPSKKLHIMRKLAQKKPLGTTELQAIAEGAFVCTTCMRCTEVCPTGINLQDQWLASRALLAQSGHPQPHVWMKDFTASEWSDRIREYEADGPDTDTIKGRFYNLTGDSSLFSPCIQCQTCTNVCPVIAANTAPADAIDVTPHKIMNLLRLGLNDLAMSSRMAWDCATCYQCQENCPQGIKVADIMYELKNRAYRRFKFYDRKTNINAGEC